MLVGRQDEVQRLADLVGAARRGNGGVLVLRGEPGIGKSALLDHVRQAASGFTVIEASGSEFESELPFAALHQLCVPVRADLPDALRVAFGLATGTPQLFQVGLATLGLLGQAAKDRPVLCLVDDAHWLDDASAKALTFLARRIASEPIAMVFAARYGLEELPSLVLDGLPDADARTLLRATLDEQVRDRIVAEARGTPLALLELPKAGGFAPPDTSTITSRIERSFPSQAGQPVRRGPALAHPRERGPDRRPEPAVGRGQSAGRRGSGWWRRGSLRPGRVRHARAVLPSAGQIRRLPSR
ncbi:AAA family ATPase [Kibdelosporangium aridum]|uniref:AAA family ATPase n=1 Tax=Kibdelosporangium aridum TaxID=2030 RepID=UPI0035E8C1DB